MSATDKKLFAANCKFGSKPLRNGQFHPGIERAKMKLIEELNQKSEKDYLDSYFEGIAKLSSV